MKVGLLLVGAQAVSVSKLEDILGGFDLGRAVLFDKKSVDNAQPGESLFL